MPEREFWYIAAYADAFRKRVVLVLVDVFGGPGANRAAVDRGGDGR